MATLSEALKEAYASAPSNDAIIETLQISHPSLPGGDIYLAKNNDDIDLALEDSSVVTFEGAGFQIALPAKADTGLSQLSIKIDNIDQRVSDFINSAKNFTTPVEVTYRVYLSSDPTTVQNDPPLILYLSDVKITLFDVTGTANFADLVNKKFPSEIYKRSRFPSLNA